MPLRPKKFRLSDVPSGHQDIARGLLSDLFSQRLTNLQSEEIAVGEKARRLWENPRVGKYHYGRTYTKKVDYGRRQTGMVKGVKTNRYVPDVRSATMETSGIGYRGSEMLREAQKQYAAMPAKIGQARLNLRSVETMANPFQELMNITGGRGMFKRKWNEMFPGG
jgi:hypothetical protein